MSTLPTLCITGKLVCKINSLCHRLQLKRVPNPFCLGGFETWYLKQKILICKIYGSQFTYIDNLYAYSFKQCMSSIEY